MFQVACAFVGGVLTGVVGVRMVAERPETFHVHWFKPTVFMWDGKSVRCRCRCGATKQGDSR